MVSYATIGGTRYRKVGCTGRGVDGRGRGSLTSSHHSLILHNALPYICPTYLRTALSVQCVNFIYSINTS